MSIFYSDFHIHSKYSRATSKNINIENLVKGAKLKGINLLGTGDFTHPSWLKELKSKLTEIDDVGIYQTNDGFNFIFSTEISNIYIQDNRQRKIHNIILAPDLDTVEQINSELSKHGRLDYDGRPIFGFTCVELVDMLKGINKDIEIIPSHCLTPWFGIFGSKSGFDTVEECFKDQARHIHALETGLSASPSMIYRVKNWDDYTLVSFSDSHSPWSWRIGRECCVFSIEKITFGEIIKIIKEKNLNKFLMTIEFPPEGGKYHFSGHRGCNVNLHPKDALSLNNLCPKCGRKLTIGVLQRVEELADRPEGFAPKDAIPFKTLLPLYEIISFVTGTNQLYSEKVIFEQNKLIEKFGNEFNVLLDVPKEELLKVTNEKIVDAIINVREGKVRYIPGYDGNYGIPIFDERFVQKRMELPTQKSLKEF